MTTAAVAALLCAACDGAPTNGDGGPPVPLDDGGPPVPLDDGGPPPADGGPLEASPGAADEVVDAPGASGMGFGDPTHAVNGVRGGGLTQQSLDVYSVPPGQYLVLGFGGRLLVDGPGPDLAVFENPFRYGDGLTFMDPTVVEVSADGETWHAFPHDYTADDETAYVPREEYWVGFAGVTPVLFSVDADPDADPFDPRAAGGDVFDLADLPALAGQPVRYVRLSAAADHDNPDTGAPFVADPVSNGPDIDGVVGRYLVEAP